MSQKNVQKTQGSKGPDTMAAAPTSNNAEQDQNTARGMKSSGGSHKMSIALVIGATIGLIGLVILLYGLFGHPDISRSDNINIDLWWGLAMLVFGLLLSIGNYLTTRRHMTQ